MTTEKFGVRYPVSGVHECPFGLEQAVMIRSLAHENGVKPALVVVDRGGGWENYYA